MAPQTQSQINTLEQTPATAPGEVDMQNGFLRVEARVRAVPVDGLELINLDVPNTVTTVLSACDRILPCRPSLVEMPQFDASNVDDLRDYALALGYTHVGNRTAFGPNDQMAEMSTKLIDTRDQLNADATALVKRGLLPPEAATRFSSGNGYRAIAFDVVGLYKVFTENWETIGPRTGVTLEELKEAYRLANQLIGATSKHEQKPAVVTDAGLLRQQAFTLLAHAYGEVRDALTYIRRRRGDVDQIAPSLWTGRGKRTAESDSAETPPAAPPTPPSTTMPALPSNSAVPVGFPGSSPLLK